MPAPSQRRGKLQGEEQGLVKSLWVEAKITRASHVRPRHEEAKACASNGLVLRDQDVEQRSDVDVALNGEP
jgi:hypothetical protein